jgi:hypothetical protein
LAPVVSAAVESAVEETCPIFTDPAWQVDPTSLAIGILIGLLVGPFIDLLFFLRHFWLDLFRVQAGRQRPLYQVVG